MPARTLFPSASKRLDLPPLSAARDARDNPLVRRLGLAGAWNFFGARLTPEGRGLLLATGAWFLWGVNALELQAHVPLIYAGCLWLAAAGALRIAKPRVRLQAAHADRVSAGQNCPVNFQVEATRAFSTRILPRALPTGLDYSPHGGAELIEKADGWTASLCLHAHRRGVYNLRGWRAYSDYPFGILRNWQDDRRESRLTVVPAFVPLVSLDLGAGRTGTGGAENLRHRGEVDEFSGNRPFRQGDAVRHIDWRSTARLQNLVVREWNSQPLLRAAVVLDTRASDAEDDEFERSVSLCAAVADYLARTGFTIDLFAAGETVHHLHTGPNQAYLDEILDLLACVQRTADVRGAGTPLECVKPQLGDVDTLVLISLFEPSQRDFESEIAAPGCAIRSLVVSENHPAVAMPDVVYVTPAAQESGVL